jgi:hypothetical protein
MFAVSSIIVNEVRAMRETRILADRSVMQARRRDELA